MFGPWQRDINPVERRARCRALAALGGVFAHQHRDFQDALVVAEGGDVAALRRASELLDKLPALNRRRLLASYAEHMAATKKALARAG
jgi:hypothetical protein